MVNPIINHPQQQHHPKWWVKPQMVGSWLGYPHESPPQRFFSCLTFFWVRYVDAMDQDEDRTWELLGVGLLRWCSKCITEHFWIRIYYYIYSIYIMYKMISCQHSSWIHLNKIHLNVGTWPKFRDKSPDSHDAATAWLCHWPQHLLRPFALW